MGLTARITSLIALPFFACLVAASLITKTNWERYQKSISVQENSQLFSSISAAVHQIQVERARSVLYTNNVGKKEDLDEQRKLANVKVSPLRDLLENSKFLPEEIKITKDALGGLEELRLKVDRKDMNGADTAKAYTCLIANLHRLQRSMAKETSLDSIETTLFSLTILEAAKENTGRLRATILSILGIDKSDTKEGIPRETIMQ